MRLMIVVLLIMLCLGCKPSQNDTQVRNPGLNTKPSKRTPDGEFELKMAEILDKYNYESSFRVHNSNSLSQIYSLVERRYFPEFRNFTFDFRKLSQASNDIALVVHIYNDSIQCILPLTDLQYYFYRSMEGNEGKYEEHMNFEPTLNDALMALRLKEPWEVEMFLDHLMSYFNASKIVEPIDVEIYKIKNNYFFKHGRFKNSCEVDLKNNNRFVVKNYKIKNSFLYSDGVVIYFFKLIDNGKIKTQILNYSCANFIVF